MAEEGKADEQPNAYGFVLTDIKTTDELKQTWKGNKRQSEVVNFYGHKEGKEYCEFSNFYQH